MASISIPWNDGPGNIVLTYTGQGNGTVTVTSDTDNLGHDRRQTITFVVTDNAIKEYVVTSNSKQLVTASGHALGCLESSMKVTLTVIQPTGMKVLVSASNHRIVTFNNHEIWVHPSS